MKTLAALILTALLAACGDCPPEVAPLPPAEVVTSTPAPVVEPELIVTPPVTTQPAPPVFCTDKITINCEVQFCPQSSAGCPPSPTPAPIRPIVTTPSPEPICTRNNEPLVMIDGVLTDNCGNKYGATT